MDEIVINKNQKVYWLIVDQNLKFQWRKISKSEEETMTIHEESDTKSK